MDNRIIRKRKRGFAALITALIMTVQFALTAGASDWEVVWDPNNIGKAQLTGNNAGENKVKTSVVEQKDPTCTEPGFVIYTATVCTSGDVPLDVYVPTHTYERDPLGHNWDSGEVTTQPTATTDGVMTFTCLRCNETKTEVIPATGEPGPEPYIPIVPYIPTYPVIDTTPTVLFTINHYQQNTDETYPDKPTDTDHVYASIGSVLSPDVKEYAGYISPEKQTINVTADSITTVDYKYERKIVTLSFDTDGGTEIAPITQKFGTAVTSPGTPEKEGSEFSGWVPEIPETMPEEDMTFKAIWTEINDDDTAGDDDSGTDDTDEADDISEDSDTEEDVIGYCLEITDIEPDEDTFALISNAARKQGKVAEDGFCWDIRLFRTVNGIKDKQIHKADEPVEVVITLSEAQRQALLMYSGFSIVRVHNGKLKQIDCLFDKENGVLSFESDRFSDYALIHEPEHIERENDDNPKTGVTDQTACCVLLISAAVIILSRKRKA